MKTREGLEIYNAHPCGCYDTETATGGIYGRLCKDWLHFYPDVTYGKCWQHKAHVCFKVTAHSI